MSQTTKTISCIIPTCDRPEFLPMAVASALKQTLPPSEILIINNGKNPVQLPTEHQVGVKLFDIIPYAGVAQARNFGACMAAGDYLAFLDDDDLWSENYLRNVQAAIEQGGRIIVSRLDKLEHGQVSEFKNAHNKITMDHLLVYNPGINGTDLVIQKSLFFKLGGFDPKLPPSEDKSLVIEALLKNVPVATLPDNQVIQRFHSGPRLINAKKMAEGIFQFTRKYRGLMTRKQLVGNWMKIYRYRYAAGDKKARFQFATTYLLRKIMRD